MSQHALGDRPASPVYLPRLSLLGGGNKLNSLVRPADSLPCIPPMLPSLTLVIFWRLHNIPTGLAGHVLTNWGFLEVQDCLRTSALSVSVS